MKSVKIWGFAVLKKVNLTAGVIAIIGMMREIVYSRCSNAIAYRLKYIISLAAMINLMSLRLLFGVAVELPQIAAVITRLCGSIGMAVSTKALLLMTV